VSLAEPYEVVPYHRSRLSCANHRSPYYTLLLVEGMPFYFILYFLKSCILNIK